MTNGRSHERTREWEFGIEATWPLAIGLLVLILVVIGGATWIVS